MFERRIEDLKAQIIAEGIKHNLLSKEDPNLMDEEFVINFAKNHGYEEYVTLQNINHAKFSIMMRDRINTKKEPIMYQNQIADDLVHLWMRGVKDEDVIDYLKEAINNGNTYVTVGNQDFNIVLESLFDKDVEPGGVHGLADKIKDLINTYKPQIEEAKTEKEKTALKIELLNMICTYYEIML
jgi:hypothetical protein